MRSTLLRLLSARVSRTEAWAVVAAAICLAVGLVGILLQGEAPAAGAPPSAAPAHFTVGADVGRLTPFGPPGFAGSSACADCHHAEAAAWRSSQHALAMAAAVPETVLGDFSDAAVSHFGSKARFRREGTRFLVETEGADGKTGTFEVAYTFGVTPLQQYLVAFPRGRFQVLPWAWDSRPEAEGGQRWFYVYSQEIEPGDPLFWTGPAQTWNHMCAECHSTGLRKNYDLEANSYHTTFSEVSVGCESCHGAGAGHVAWARSTPRPDNPSKGFAAAFTPRPAVDWSPDRATGSPPLVPAGRTAGDEVEACARCHARRGLLSEDWHPGRPLADTHLPTFLSEGLFEADGQMLDEVFNDHAFKQSKMYAAGVVCTDCHDAHSGSLKAEGATVCSQCHLPERFETVAHTGHTPGPAAPTCITCHMPARTFMRVDTRHDHSFRIPRPDLTATLGTPNSCKACHEDRTAQWAADAIARWHGPERKGFQTWAAAFHAARGGDPAARERLIALADDPETPGLVRATALDELGRFPARASLEALRQGLSDPDPLVRVAALQGLRPLQAGPRWQLAGPLLGDPVRAVRLAAARALADVPQDRLPAADAGLLRAALEEYEASLRLNADMPEGRANLATYFLLRGDPQAAERQLRAGLAIEPGAVGLAVNLADLYRRSGRETESERLLRDALERNPDAAALHYALGLGLVRQKRQAEAIAELSAAARLDPAQARYAYGYVVALRSAGEAQEADATLAAALGENPYDANLLGLALNEALSRHDLAAARALAERLAPLRPDDAGLADLLSRLRAAGAQ